MLTLAICGALLGALTMWRANRFVTRALGAVPALAGVVLLHAHAPLPPAADRKRLEDFCRHVGWDIGARYHGQLPALGERPDQGATPAGAFLVQLDALTPFLASAGALCVRDTTSCLRRVNEFPREASVLNARAMAPLIDDLEAAFYTGEPCAREGTSSAPTPPQPSPAASARAWWPLALSLGVALLGCGLIGTGALRRRRVAALAGALLLGGALLLTRRAAAWSPQPERARLDAFCGGVSATIAAWHGEPVPRYEEGAFRYLVARESIGVLRDYVKRAGALCLRDSAPCDHRMRTAELDYRIDHAPDTDALVEDLIAAFQTRTTCPARTAGGAP